MSGDTANEDRTTQDRRTWADHDVERDATSTPEVIGRYEVLETLGAGGMGTVFCAYDPQLDRKVALKLLHAQDAGDDDATRARSRLQREARAIAQVKHPNVIHVYDVGLVMREGHEQVFVAMELVEGRSLRTWLEQLRATDRWSRGQATAEIVEVMAQAGRGLAAAHQAGLVHRDFKPDNALLGDDGLVRVVDFGLARRADADTESVGDPPSEAPGLETEQDHSGSLDERITRTGAALGTPAYMAPEQFLGSAIDGRADQFAFCLTLFEALYGTRAFPLRGTARAMAVIQGRKTPFPSEPSVPAYLRSLLLRGLQTRPEDRYASMTALVDALLDDPAVRRRQRLRWLLAATGVIATAGVVVATRPDPPAAEDPCGHGVERMDTVWNAERAAAVDHALRVETLPYGASVAETTRNALDAYADAWTAAHRDACEATHVRHEQTGARLDQRVVCLDRRLAAVEASVELLAAAEPEQVEHAVGVAVGLPALEPCADPAALEASGPPPPDAAKADAIAQVHAQLERMSARQRLHRFDEALAMADTLAPRVESIGHAPLQAEFLYARGMALVTADQFEPGEQALRDALMRAQALGMDRQVRDAASDLSQVLAGQLARPDDALPWADLAEATDERIGSTPASRASLLRARAWVLVAWGMKPEAIDVVARAHETALEVHEPDAFEMIEIYAGLGIVYAQLRELERAIPHFERALELTEMHLGPQHPEVIGQCRNLGNALAAMKRPEEAERYLGRAAALIESLPGASARDEALIASSLGNLAMQRKDYEQAATHHRRALALREEIYGPEHPMVARSLNSLAGPTKRLGRIDEAIALFRRSLELREASMGAEDPSLMFPLGNLGVMLVEEGRPAEAVPLLDRSFALMQKHGDVASRKAEHRWWLGRALVESGLDADQGMAQIHEARTRLEALEVDHNVEIIDQWLESRGAAATP